MWKKSLFFLSFLFFLHQPAQSQQFSNLLNPDPGKNIGTCVVCGADVFSGMLTRVDLVTDTDTLHTCSLACAAVLLKKEKVKSARVVDYPTATFCDLKKAFFVIKSNIIPVRGKMPILAFREKLVAAEFTKVHHGVVLNSHQILELVEKLRQEKEKSGSGD